MELFEKLTSEIGKVIFGKDDVVTLLVSTMLAGGHALIEDLPGTGKTMLAKTLAAACGGDFKRIQCTPDLMPSDVTGLNIYNPRENDFRLVKGPVFSNVVLADEINRATPRTQSSLLEAMEERQVTIDGVTLALPDFFILVATENPIETTGTYPLPEAQLDRFMTKLSMGGMDARDEKKVIDHHISGNPIENVQAVTSPEEILAAREKIRAVYVHEAVKDYVTSLAAATRESGRITVGVSTRAVLGILRLAQAYAYIHDRDYVTPDDIKYLMPYAWGHRITYFGGAAKGSELIAEATAQVEVPNEDWKTN